MRSPSRLLVCSALSVLLAADPSAQSMGITPGVVEAPGLSTSREERVGMPQSPRRFPVGLDLRVP